LVKRAVADGTLGATGATGAAGADVADATAPTARNIDNPATNATGLEISLDRRSVLLIKLSWFVFLSDRQMSLVCGQIS
jgi:autotransporter adhesin